MGIRSVGRPPGLKECAAIVTWFTEHGILPGSRILDAGCGTGRYTLELSRRGYSVHGIDASADLIAQANLLVRGTSGSLSFTIGNISTLSGASCDGILCRGVANDINGSDARRSVAAEKATEARLAVVLITRLAAARARRLV